MNKNWSKTTLGSLGKISMCKRILKEETSELGDIPFYKISTFGGVADAFISKDIFEKYRETYSYPKIGDILISAAGTLGKTVIFDGKPSYFQDSNIVWVANDEKTVINSFLYYFYQTNPWVKTTGSTINRLYNNDIKNLEIYFPDTIKQQSIAAVLSALDKKIALNKQINARLEEMAKTLYDYWFVQFDFPDANGKPYKSSGGEMVFDETLKREIPKGWKSGNILNIANLLGGGTPSKSSPEYWNGNIPFFTPTDCDNSIFILDTADRITDAGLCNSSTRLFKKHSIFITARGSVGRSSINAVPMAMNQSCYAFQAKENVSYTFLFFLIRELIMILEVKATGSVFNSIVSSDIETTNLVISNKDLIRKFGEYCEPLFNQIETNLKQNHQLTQLRDFLLPMLMNGQVSVAE
jgi:hypothetical protein